MKENLTIVKVGGAVVEDEAQLSQLLKDFSAIEGRKVLVHGGGRKATKVAEALGIESKMVNGRRITDADMLSVVTMVYGGLVNKNLVARLQANGDHPEPPEHPFSLTLALWATLTVLTVRCSVALSRKGLPL